MKKVFFANCIQCGKVELYRDFTDHDGSIIIPVVYAPTVNAFAKIYKEIVGVSYEKNVGYKPNKSEYIRKKWLKLTHAEFDDPVGAINAHTFKKRILCWTDNP